MDDRPRLSLPRELRVSDFTLSTDCVGLAGGEAIEVRRFLPFGVGLSGEGAGSGAWRIVVRLAANSLIRALRRRFGRVDALLEGWLVCSGGGFTFTVLVGWTRGES